MKIKSSEELKKIVEQLHSEEKTVVFTNGCFDLFHAGHLKSFLEAKKKADVLIVAVNSNESVKENKGDARPIIDECDRMELIAALECVDYVVLFNEKSPAGLIEFLSPDIYVKGGDWRNKELPEKEVLDKIDAKVEYIDLKEGLSTTWIIQRVKDVYK